MAGPQVTLALGGGGARGAAHLGVIEVLEDAGFEIHRVVGVSIGSLVGSMYARTGEIGRAQDEAVRYLLSPRFRETQQVLFGAQGGGGASGGMFGWYSRVKSYLRANRIFHRVVKHPSMLPGVILQDVISHLLPEMDITEAEIPLTIVALDLLSGHRVLLERGPLRMAVQASSSLPAIFPPVMHQNMQLCDIGAFNTLPALVAQSYHPQFVVAVDVSSPLPRIGPCETALDVLMRVDELSETLFRRYSRQSADLLIRPDVGGVEWFDFSRTVELIDAGRAAAREAIRALPQAIRSTGSA